MYNTLPDNIDFEAYWRSTESKSQRMTNPSDYIEETLERMYGDNSTNYAKLLWGPFDVFFKPGEVTIWAGVNGHGKSLVISQVMLHFMQQGYKCGVASFELVPEALNKRMVLQAARSYPTPGYVKDFLNWADGKVFYADVRGSANQKDVLGMVRYAVREKNVEHFFIDNLMCCVPGEQEYDAQKNFMFALAEMARELNVHVHLVHHIRKLDNEVKDQPNKFDIKGTGAITDRADNIIIVWRNKKKEEQIAKGKSAFKEEEWQMWLDAFDTMLRVDKQRDGGEEGNIKLKFHKESMSYVDQSYKLDPKLSGFNVPKVLETSIG